MAVAVSEVIPIFLNERNAIEYAASSLLARHRENKWRKHRVSSGILNFQWEKTGRDGSKEKAAANIRLLRKSDRCSSFAVLSEAACSSYMT